MESISAIVESPKGSAVKFKYQPDTRSFKLHKALPAGMVFPFDFGFIPDTKGEDGDPLDIVVVSEFQTFTGCVMDCRIIGGIKVKQTEKDGRTLRNDRFIGIASVSQLFAAINNTDDFSQRFMDELTAFFKNYSELTGKKFEALGSMTPDEANTLIQKGKD